jgi:hypothetical protein
MPLMPRCLMPGLSVLLAVLIAPMMARAAPLAPGEIQVVAEFCPLLEKAVSLNAADVSRRQRAFSGGEMLDAIYLHPNSTPEDSVLTFPAVNLPSAELGASAFLVFRYGMQDDIPWDTEERPAEWRAFSRVDQRRNAF